MHRGDCENLFEPWSARNERKRRIRGNKSTLLKYVGSPGSNGSKGENSEEKRRKFVEGNEREERHFLTSRVETDEWLGNEWSLLSRTEQKPRKQNSSTAGGTVPRGSTSTCFTRLLHTRALHSPSCSTFVTHGGVCTGFHELCHALISLTLTVGVAIQF